MGSQSNRPALLLAQFEMLDAELDAALQEIGLPGLDQKSHAGGERGAMPEVMRLCSVDPLELRHTELRKALEAGADPNAKCPWGAMPIDTLYTSGDGDALAMLLAYGASADDYDWSAAHLAVIRDDAVALAACDPVILATPDRLGDTPFQLACRMGRVNAVCALVTPEQATDALMIAASSGSVAVIKALMHAGVDINMKAPDGNTALLVAVEAGQVDLVAYLLAQGADLDAVVDVTPPTPHDDMKVGTLNSSMDLMFSRLMSQIPAMPKRQYNTIYTTAYAPEVIRELVQYGADPAQFLGSGLQAATGLDQRPIPTITRDVFAAQYRVRYGRANPEQVATAFWEAQIRTGHPGAFAKDKIAGHKTVTDGPVWSFARSGRSATQLPNGSWVLIGGRHQDEFDPHHCIYNDVTVVDPSGMLQHFIYPPSVFPPTDFHTAVLADDGVWIIGSLGYQRDRKLGETPVCWLSLTDFSIHKIATTGQKPGWVHQHTATLIDGAIHISGGCIEPGGKTLKGRFVLDLARRHWQAVN